MANFTRNGYGQVEPNQLSAQKTGQIYASLPLDPEVKVLQNGEFMYYDYANGTVNSGKVKGEKTVATVGEPMLVFNEIKLYDEAFRTTYKDFAMIRVGDNYVTSVRETEAYGDGAETKGDYVDHTTYDNNPSYRMQGIAPRLFKTNIGDIMTTNMVVTGVEYAVGDLLEPKADNTSKTMVLTKATAPTGMAWSVVKVYTMPDGQPGLKLQRVQ